MWALVPIKSTSTAKSRLSAILDPDERRCLHLAMARHVMLTLQAVGAIEQVAVVTHDRRVAELAEELHAVVLAQDEDRGTAHACRFAVAQLRHRTRSLLMISGDLPLVRASSIARFAPTVDDPGAAGFTPRVMISPDRHGTGTNALLCSAPDVIPVCFGPGSFALHLAAARERDVALKIIDAEDIGLDIDTPDDLRRLHAVLNATPDRLSPELREIFAEHLAMAAQP